MTSWTQRAVAPLASWWRERAPSRVTERLATGSGQRRSAYTETERGRHDGYVDPDVKQDRRESTDTDSTQPTSEARDNLVDRTRFVFSVPSWPVSAGGSLLVGALAGAIGFGVTPSSVAAGVVSVGCPALVGTALTTALDRRRDGSFDTDRSALLALSCSVVAGVFAAGGAGIEALGGGGPAVVREALLIAAAGTFALRSLVILAVSGPPLVGSVLPAATQPVATIAAVLGVAGITAHSGLATPTTLAITAASAVLYSGIVLGLVALIDRPLRREWGVSGFEFVHQFLEYTAGREGEFESFLTKLGEPVTVPVRVLSIRGPSGEEKARVVSPAAHPGPFAGIGGGSLPYRLAEDGSGLTFVPHGMADHDYNPASRRDVETLADAARRAHADVTYDPLATPPIQQRADEATLTGQSFGDGALLTTTFAPLATDDVTHEVGQATARATQDVGIEHPLLVDAHNSRSPEDATDGRTTPETARARTLTSGVEGLATDLDASERGRLRVGVAADPTPWDSDEGIGPLGVRALATEVAGTTAVWVLIDGNNLLGGLRSAIRDALDADVVEVATTDSHEVNHLRSTNYVGTEIDTDELVAVVAGVGQAALADLEVATAGAATARAEITVPGAGTIEDLAAFADRSLPRCRLFVALTTPLVTGISAALFRLGHWVPLT